MDDLENRYTLPAEGSVPTISQVDFSQAFLAYLPKLAEFKASQCGHLWEWVHREAYLIHIQDLVHTTRKPEFHVLSDVGKLLIRGKIVCLVEHFLTSITGVARETELSRKLVLLRQIHAVDRLHELPTIPVFRRKLRQIEAFLSGSFETFNLVGQFCVNNNYCFEFLMCYKSAVFVFNNFVHILNQIALSSDRTTYSILFSDQVSGGPCGLGAYRNLNYYVIHEAFMGVAGSVENHFPHTTYGRSLLAIHKAYVVRNSSRMFRDAGSAVRDLEYDVISWTQFLLSDRRVRHCRRRMERINIGEPRSSHESRSGLPNAEAEELQLLDVQEHDRDIAHALENARVISHFTGMSARDLAEAELVAMGPVESPRLVEEQPLDPDWLYGL